jgi:hypothetical protein
MALTLLHIFGEALGSDRTLCYDAALGVIACGDVPAFDAFEYEEQQAELDFDALDHKAWNRWLQSDIETKASLADTETREDIEAVIGK